jgi:GTP-binding protein EngB required for normal cell division
VILLIDTAIGLSESDKMLVEMLTETHRPFITIMTKADKVKDGELLE